MLLSKCHKFCVNTQVYVHNRFLMLISSNSLLFQQFIADCPVLRVRVCYQCTVNGRLRFTGFLLIFVHYCYAAVHLLIMPSVSFRMVSHRNFNFCGNIPHYTCK